MTWEILTAIAVAVLVYSFFGRRNAIWGGLIIGVIIGFIATLFLEFSWVLVGRFAVVATILGMGSELLGMASDRMRRGDENK